MTTTPASPTPGRRANPAAAGDWPVLARLPDVSPQISTEQPQSMAMRLVARPSTAYRLDAPKVADMLARSNDVPTASERNTEFTTIISEGSPKRPQPHLHHRKWRVDQAVPVSHRNSAALPSSNPFAIPSAGLDDTLAPIARFVMLFVLFTIAGTAVLLASKNRTKPQPAPAAAAKAPVLEPTTVIRPVRTVLDEPIAATTASGLAGDAPAAHRDPSTETLPPFPDVLSPSAETENEQTASEQVSSGPAGSNAKPPTSASEFLTSPLTGAGRALPQVRTSEPPASVARLPGYILESSSR